MSRTSQRESALALEESAIYAALASWAAGAGPAPFLRKLATYLGVNSVRLQDGALVPNPPARLDPRRKKFFSTLNRQSAAITRSHQELSDRADLVRRMTVDLLDLEEAGRREMSRRLHDEAGQALVCIRLHMELMQQGEVLSQEMLGKLGEIRDLTEQSILEIRRLISELSPRVLEQLGLSAAIRQFAARLQGDYKVLVKVKLPKAVSLSRQLEIAVYRIIQDSALEFATRFSATNVNISLASADGVLSLRVSATGDDQTRSGPQTAAESYRLKGIENRVALLGGKCEFLGTRATQKMPVRKHKVGLSVRIELPISEPAKKIS